MILEAKAIYDMRGVENYLLDSTIPEASERTL